MAQHFYFNGHTYEFVTTASTWAVASANANKVGAHLATLTSAAEDAAVFSNASVNAGFLASAPTADDGGGAKYIWLGASDRVAEGVWKWVDDAAVSGYTNWGSGSFGTEPDNYGGIQDALAMGLQAWPRPSGGIGVAGKWNDISESNSLYSVIEWDYLYGTSGEDNLIGTSANDTLQGAAGNDSVDGGAGIDTAKFSSNWGNYKTSTSNNFFNVSDQRSGNDGTDSLSGVERLKFTDKSIAIDLQGNAGITAKVIGAVLGSSSVKNPTIVGIGLSYTDKGMSYSDLGALALSAVGVITNDAIVTTLWRNVVGFDPSAAEKEPFIKMLADGMKAGDLVVLAAETSLNTINIGLVGLIQTGIEYTLA